MTSISGVGTTTTTTGTGSTSNPGSGLLSSAGIGSGLDVNAIITALVSWLTVSVLEPVATRFRVTPFSAPLTELLALVTAMPSMLRLASLASFDPAVFSVVASDESPALLPLPALTLKALATPVLVEVSSSCAPFAPLTIVACTPGLPLDWLIAVAMLLI
jgi:hypothetical protein